MIKTTTRLSVVTMMVGENLNMVASMLGGGEDRQRLKCLHDPMSNTNDSAENITRDSDCSSRDSIDNFVGSILCRAMRMTALNI